MSFVLSNKTLFFNAFVKYGITTPLRIAHFLGQLAHESRNFTASVESISYDKAQKKYQNHKYLGNTKVGDGYRFRGRGLIQLTGRGNYQRYKNYSGIDIVNNPSLASNLSTSIDIACWYWVYGSAWGNLNKYADLDNVTSITKGINGGTNGLEERIKLVAYYKAQNVTLEVLKKKVQLRSSKPANAYAWDWLAFNSKIFK